MEKDRNTQNRALSFLPARRPDLCNTPPIVSILTSEDGGHTWMRHEGTALDGLTVTEIVVHPTNADIAWAATAGGGVFRTSDGGTTWEPTSNGLWANMVMDLAGDPDNPDVLYAGTATSGVFKSEDGGASWQQSSAGMDPNEPIGALVVDPVRPNTVYAGSWMSGVYISQDAGATWRLINDGLRTRSVRALAISSDGKVIYAGTRGEGVFRLGEVSPCALEGDVDRSGHMDIKDITRVAEHWHLTSNDLGYDDRYDLDGDGDIDVVDVMRVAVQWDDSCFR